MRTPPLPAVLACSLFAGAAAMTAGAGTGGRAHATPATAAELSELAPTADLGVLALAIRARTCAIHSGAVGPQSALAVIDYSRASTQPRLWVFDMAVPRLLFFEYVAHGKGSGANFATHFSNQEASRQSSIGVFRTAETYVGGHGYSLRLDGLEPGVNDRARERLLVMHGAWYVDPVLAARQGRLGRSFGCPALRPAMTHQVIDALKGGNLLFAYYPVPEWLATSRFLHCSGNPSGG